MQATMTMPVPVSVPAPLATGNLEGYIQSVNRFPILSAEEEQALARRYRESGDLERFREVGLELLGAQLHPGLSRSPAASPPRASA